MVNTLSAAISLLGLKQLATACGVTHQAVLKWVKRKRLPRTEYSGETNYAAIIAKACKDKDPHAAITREALLGLESGAQHLMPRTAAQERVA